MQAEAPVPAAKEPALHVVHVAVAPVADEALPAGQLTQLAAPVDA